MNFHFPTINLLYIANHELYKDKNFFVNNQKIFKNFFQIKIKVLFLPNF